MQSSRNHIIDKVFLEVNTTDEKMANKIKNNVSSFLNLEVFPKLEQLLDKYDFSNQVFRIDSLDIDFRVQDWDRPEEIKYEFLNNIEQKIEETLSKNNKDFIHDNFKTDDGNTFERPLQQAVSKEQNYQTTFLFFLENGFLPWFGKQEYIEELTSSGQWQESMRKPGFWASLKELLQRNRIAIKRFVFQFSDEQILSFIDSSKTVQIKNIAELLTYLKSLSTEFRNSYLTQLIIIVLDTTINNRGEFIEFVKQQILEKNKVEIDEQLLANWNHDFLTKAQHYLEGETGFKYFRLTDSEVKQIVIELKNIIAGTHLGVGAKGEELQNTNLENKPTIVSQEFVNSVMEKEPPFFEKDINEIVVRNAGLVLFHPFLKAYFSQFDWIDNKGKIKSEHKFEAVQALHYCATGDEKFFEGNLLFEKFLCGVPLAMPIPIELLLNEQVKIEADEMAAQLINYWSALKNTSPDGLREMFINRNGKLIQKQNDYRLIVERKAQDILLDKLPWNISIVKLPWKDKLLFIEW